MAKRKEEVRIEPWSKKGEFPSYFSVHADEDMRPVIDGVEGAIAIGRYNAKPPYRVRIDPRYDTDEVLDDIREAVTKEQRKRRGEGEEKGEEERERRGNVRHARGVDYERRIGDMRPGDCGWTVPWAYNPETNTVSPQFPVYDQEGGTVEMVVRCVDWGEYTIDNTGDYKW